MRACFVRVFVCMLVCILGHGSVSLSQNVTSLFEDKDLGLNMAQTCNFTRYPGLCIQTLTSGRGVLQFRNGFLRELVKSTVHEIRKLSSIMSQSSQAGKLENPKSHDKTTDYCVELLHLSLKRLHQSLSALNAATTHPNALDIQTWLSAVLSFLDGCNDALNIHISNSIHDPSAVHNPTSVSHVSSLASNALAVANRLPKKRREKGRRLLVDADFPSWLTETERRLLQAPEIAADAVVAQDGTGNFLTVSEALDKAPGDRRYVIHVKAGIYKERIVTAKDGITLIGDGKAATIVTGSRSVGGGSTMPESATFAVIGDGFIARDIGFQNSAGPSAGQALAVRVLSDHSVFYRCNLIGYQDTLYAMALRQFYRECDVYGTIDFIFGNAAAVFQSCNLYLRLPATKENVILANGRNDPCQNTGFSVHNCRIAAASDLFPVRNSIRSYLGRPWKKYSRSVVMESSIDGIINPKGWQQWEGSFALKTLYFGEYRNQGPGSGTAGRVRWPGVHELASEEAEKFTVGSFISGTTWLPSTGVAFQAGLGGSEGSG
ncbi:pectinesterase [Amborella trichopoda]|uniref:Pectinesterase n=1 Tax=Amborella trichopoda TaxID=13333 RepID=W1NKI0_AMBTC|nr:pectinesterase [Amborella trichopoda]ERM96028.1 hypothetical protein AMTR_s00129p00073090 [Amborella trichopoda]|eukprot:XP_011628675.2 pectinesterase [Amborella trichopoda]